MGLVRRRDRAGHAGRDERHRGDAGRGEGEVSGGVGEVEADGRVAKTVKSASRARPTRRRCLFARIAVSKIGHGDREQFRAHVVMHRHSPL
jgi:hypothetical protein